jgi:hypothetical protein|tara:strand:- start:107 stop:298 length:192 start_codon:yes stop_codon:yes gene_type:complete
MNYDKWKLSTPEDYGSDYVSNCCGARVDNSELRCSDCGEGCEAIEDYEYEAIRKENYLEDRDY